MKDEKRKKELAEGREEGREREKKPYTRPELAKFGHVPDFTGNITSF